MFRTALALTMLAAGALPAAAADYDYPLPAPQQHYAVSSLCGSSSAIGYIKNRFAWAQSRTWHTGLSIQTIDLVEETGARVGGPSLIDRVYCQGRAYLSDGRAEPVFWLIESRQGFAGHGKGVSFCLPTFDQYRVYDAWCRTVRP